MTYANKLKTVLPNPPTGGILQQIHSFLDEKNVSSYRYGQILTALQKGNDTFDKVQNLPKSLTNQLIEKFGTSPLPLTVVEAHSSAQAEKVLFKTVNEARIETVLSYYKAGWTSMCISTQCGCGLGCTFCATGAMGLMRNLTADEICRQVFHPHWKQKLPDSIAFMGMGEALANPNTFQSIKILTDPLYGKISPRRLTLSTVGVSPGLERLITEHPQVTITLSVHSPFPEERATLIPLEKKFPLKENLALLDKYVKRHNRKIYLAYLLIDGLNDTSEHLTALAGLIRAQYRPELYHVSVIGYNTAFGANPDYRSPALLKVSKFVDQLHKKGISATKRMQFGSNIEAACGQLHADYMQKKKM